MSQLQEPGIYPIDQGNWDNFIWTEPIDLGKIAERPALDHDFTPMGNNMALPISIGLCLRQSRRGCSSSYPSHTITGNSGLFNFSLPSDNVGKEGRRLS